MGATKDAMIGRVVLGRYRIVRALAKGGMGVVYLGRSEGAVGFTKPVVVKRMASDLGVDPAMARMFVREARIMARLRHPGIVGVVDFGEEDGDYLMVIEYVHGFTLGQWSRFAARVGRPLPPEIVLQVVIELLDALHYAHELCDDDGAALRIVHRDVSPANVLIDVEGLVKLADFGIARSRDQTEQTEASTIKGKMPYVAPELFKLEQPSPSSDTYACAVVLHELLMGQNELKALDLATTVSRVLEHVPTNVESVRDDLPPGLGEVLARALAKTREERYPDAAALASALRALRPVGEDEMQARVRALVRRDFTDPTFSPTLGIASLAEREHAQRSAPRGVPAPSAATRRPARWTWLALATVGVAAAIGGAWMSGDDAPTFVFVERSTSADEAAIADGGQAGQRATADASPRDAGRRTSSDPIDPITRAFRRNRLEMDTCIRAEGARASARFEVVVRIEADGSVTSARLHPPELGGTSLGRCILRVARSTRFPSGRTAVMARFPVRF